MASIAYERVVRMQERVARAASRRERRDVARAVWQGQVYRPDRVSRRSLVPGGPGDARCELFLRQRLGNFVSPSAPMRPNGIPPPRPGRGKFNSGLNPVPEECAPSRIPKRASIRFCIRHEDASKWLVSANLNALDGEAVYAD